MRDFNFRRAESLSTFAQWKQAAECQLMHFSSEVEITAQHTA